MSMQPQESTSQSIPTLIGLSVGVVGLGSIIFMSILIVVCTVKLIRKFCLRRDNHPRASRSRRQIYDRNVYFSVRGDFTNQPRFGLIEWNSSFVNNPYCVDAIDM